MCLLWWNTGWGCVLLRLEILSIVPLYCLKNTPPSESPNQSNKTDRLSCSSHKSIIKPPSSHVVGIRKLHYNSDCWRTQAEYSCFFLRSEFWYKILIMADTKVDSATEISAKVNTAVSRKTKFSFKACSFFHLSSSSHVKWTCRQFFGWNRKESLIVTSKQRSMR